MPRSQVPSSHHVELRRLHLSAASSSMSPSDCKKPHLRPCSFFPAGTAGIYQGANGLTSAAGFGSVHQVHPPVVVSVLSFKSPLKSGHPECLLLPLTPTRNPSLFFPGFGCHRGDCKWPLERYRVEAEKLDERDDILYYILT